MNEPIYAKIYSPDHGILYRHKPRAPKRNPVNENQPEKIYWTIGEVAEMLNIAPSNVRFWCVELGIETGRGSGKRRKFKHEHINKLKLVAAMVNDGVHLWKIKETINKKS